MTMSTIQQRAQWAAPRTQAISQIGSAFVDRSIVALTAQQAAGTDPVLAANPARRALQIVPPAACMLRLASGAAGGVPLRGDQPNQLAGPSCPTNALYVTGLAAGALLTILEA